MEQLLSSSPVMVLSILTHLPAPAAEEPTTTTQLHCGGFRPGDQRCLCPPNLLVGVGVVVAAAPPPALGHLPISQQPPGLLELSLGHPRLG